MLRLTCAVLVGASFVMPAIAAPKGKVVRVERTRTFPLVTPVICFQMQSDGTGLCVGPQPKQGDIIVLVDESAVLAEIKVEGMTKAMPSCDVVWQVNGSVIKGDVSAGRRSKTMGLIDAGIDRSAARRIAEDKIAKPTPDTRVEIGIDRDGDGQADMLVAQGTCPGVGNECLEFWSRRPKGLEKVWSSNLRACSP